MSLHILVVLIAVLERVSSQPHEISSALEPPPSLPQPLNGNSDPCQFVSNITDGDNLQQHEFVVLEQCLYYFLAGRAQQAASKFGVVNALSSLPPSFATGRQIPVTFHRITLQHFQLNEFLKDLSIHGYMEISWDDERTKWNRDQWKLDKLKIQSVNHLWIPIFAAQTFDTALRNGDMMEMRRIEASKEGNISALISFSLRTFCDDEWSRYPDDTYKCCFQLQPHLNQDQIQMIADGSPIYTDPKYFRDYGFSMSGTVPSVQNDPAGISQYAFCMNLQRASEAVRIELSLPSTVCAILFLLTPLLGVIQLQILAKAFVLLLQFLTLILFSNRISPHLGSAAGTPGLLRFLEFAIVMNALSISVSVFLWVCSKMKRTLPPWSWLIRLSDVINKFFCVFNTISTSNATDSLDTASTSKMAAYQEDWLNAFRALHGLIMLVISVVFLFGYALFT